MAEHHPQYLPDRLLQGVVNRQVQERLGSMFRELGEFTKDMTTEDTKAAKLMILEMVRNAAGEFYTKMQSRIERNEPPNVDNGRRIQRQ